jgi:hypothetical protein
MKRLLLGLILLLAATAGLAQSRDVLLTPDGTLYTVNVTQADDGSLGPNYLKLTEHQGNKSTEIKVPDSLNGTNLRPALAYDGDSDTLFVLWLHQSMNSTSNELYLASYHAGTWQPAVTIDNESGVFYAARFNLRIAVTHVVSQQQKDGTFADAPALLVHAVWWEENSTNPEGARYALVATDKGVVTSVDSHAMSAFALPAETTATVGDDFNRDFLRHPTLIDNPASDSVDVVFGDLATNTLNRVTLKPVADSRVHIPVGNRGGGHPIAVPKALSVDWSGHASTLDGRNGRMMFVNTTADAVSYVSYANGKWTMAKTITTDANITTDAAMAAITKMLASE